jgi:hypothetical protein
MILPTRRILILALAVTAPAAVAAELPQPAPVGEPATTVYRQVLPGGRIIYSDRPVKGAKMDQTITVDPPAVGTISSGTSGASSASTSRSGPGTADRVSTIPPSGRTKTLDDATADVIRAEILLDDAHKRMEAGAEPLPGERVGTATGGTRLNDDYHARQKRLAEEVAVAENVLKKSIAERDALRDGR